VTKTLYFSILLVGIYSILLNILTLHRGLSPKATTRLSGIDWISCWKL